MDETEEARVALRFASRRAAKTGGAVHMLTVLAPSPSSPLPGFRPPSRKRPAPAPRFC
jgi:hypothetical protein